ncbi:MAG: hypothetical protein AB3N09_04020 [Tateyamaria sp.]
MADPDNPLLPVQQKVVRIETRLIEFLRVILSKVKPMTMSLAAFLSHVRKSAKDLAAKVGKAAIDSILKAGTLLVRSVALIERQTLDGIKLARSIISTIRKAAQPEKVFKTIKKMVARVAKLFRLVVSKVAEVMAALAPVEAVLSVINTFSLVLRMVLKWIKDVAGVSGAVKKARSLLKKSLKMLRQEAKAVTKLVKEVNQLKPA